MKRLLWTLLILCLTTFTFAQNIEQTFVASDIDNFWIAYDKINSTRDSVLQVKFLKELYLDKGTEGLQSLVQSRNYTETEFITWITNYPKFWQSLKLNTLQLKDHYSIINNDIEKLRKLYPGLKPATIYFTIGAFRTNGMTHGNKILIGSEFSLADKSTNVSEFPGWRQEFYKNQNPLMELGLLCTHEYIHTQQQELVENLLSMCLYEGVAEFVSCIATEKKSASPAIEFGKVNQKIVIEQFVSDMFIMTNNYNWLWGENRNELKVRDLGYYVGYEICER